MNDDNLSPQDLAIKHENAKSDYMDKRKLCPHCGSHRITSTLAGWGGLPGSEIKNTNHAHCQHCGWKGIVHELDPKPVASEGVKVKETFTVTREPAFATEGHADHSKNLGVIDTGNGPVSLQEANRILDARAKGEDPKAATVKDVEDMIKFQQQIDAANSMAFNAILDLLQVALELDPEAISKLLRTRVPINDKLNTTTADILVGSTPGKPDMSVLGLLNSCLQAGLKRRLVAVTGDGPTDKIILALGKWNPPSQQAEVPSLDEPAIDTVSKTEPGPLND